jgi:hypothetical protein
MILTMSPKGQNEPCHSLRRHGRSTSEYADPPGRRSALPGHASAPFARSAAEHHARPNQFDPAVGVARRLFEASRKTVHHALNHGRAIPGGMASSPR